MEFSYNTYGRSPDWGGPPCLPEQFRAAAKAGYDFVGIDLPAVEAHTRSGSSLTDLRKELDDAGVPCFELIALHIDEDPATTRQEIERALPVVEAFGPSAVLVVPAAVDRFVALNLDECARRFSDHGAFTAIEFVAGRPVNTIDQAISLADMTAEDVRLVVDVWHVAHGPDSLADLAGVPRDRIGFIQLSDAPPWITDDPLYETRHRRVMPGDGDLEVEEFCRVVTEDVGYHGVASVEILSDHWRSVDLETFVQRSLDSSRAVCARS